MKSTSPYRLSARSPRRRRDSAIRRSSAERGNADRTQDAVRRELLHLPALRTMWNYTSRAQHVERRPAVPALAQIASDEPVGGPGWTNSPGRAWVVASE